MVSITDSSLIILVPPHPKLYTLLALMIPLLYRIAPHELIVQVVALEHGVHDQFTVVTAILPERLARLVQPAAYEQDLDPVEPFVVQLPGWHQEGRVLLPSGRLRAQMHLHADAPLDYARVELVVRIDAGRQRGKRERE